MKKIFARLPWWKEGLLFVVAVLLIFRFFQNIDVFWLGVQRFLSIITPFIVGAVIAYFLSRPCRRLEKQLLQSKIKFFEARARGFSVLLVFLTVVVILSLIFSYVTPIIAANLGDFLNHYQLVIQFVNDLGSHEWLDAFNLDDALLALTEMISMEQVLGHFTTSLTSIGSYIMTMTSGIVATFLSAIISLYMLVYTDSVLAMVGRISRALIPEPRLSAMTAYIRKLDDIFFQFIYCQFLDACILGTLATILLAIIGVEYAVTLGLLLGICNMIPYFGSIFASIVTFIITIFTGGIHLALVTITCLLVLQQIDGNFIGPRLMGGALNLNPMLIIFSITVGGAYFGIIGMFISVPIAAMLKMMFNDVLEMREEKLRGV